MSPGRRLALLGALLSALAAGVIVARPASVWLSGHGLLLPFIGLATLGALVVLERSARPGAGPLGLLLASFALLAWCLPVADEALHMPVYTLVGVAAWWLSGLRLGPAAVLVAVLGLGDELAQGLQAGRSFALSDVMMDLGVGVAAVGLHRPGRGRWVAAALPCLGALAVTLRADPAAPSPSAAAAALQPTVYAAGPDRTPPPLEVSAAAPYAGYNIVLVTVDALRADFVPPWGEAPVPLPAFERLARESIAPDEVLANAHWTSPGIVSLLTGLHPAVHGVMARGLAVAPGASLPLEALGAAGWSVQGFAGDRDETYEHLGVARQLDRQLSPSESLADALAAAGDRPLFAGCTCARFTALTTPRPSAWPRWACPRICPTTPWWTGCAATTRCPGRASPATTAGWRPPRGLCTRPSWSRQIGSSASCSTC